MFEVIGVEINLGKSIVYSAIARLITLRHPSCTLLVILTKMLCIQEVKITVVRIQKIFALHYDVGTQQITTKL